MAIHGRVLLGIGVALAAGGAEAQGTPTLPFKFDRTAEDWSALKDPEKHTRPWHELKWLEFGGEGHATFGGELKARGEWIDAPNFGATGLDDDAYLLQRALLHADVTFNSHVRTFVQLGLHDGSERDVFFPLDDGGLDLHQGFLELNFGTPAKGVSVRAGRQEITLSPRLVASREGANMRSAYDGVRVTATQGRWRAEAFASHPVTNLQGDFDDESDTTQRFDGLRATYTLGEKKLWRATGSLYSTHRDRQRVGAVVAEDDRLTLGLKFGGAQDGWDFDAEHHVQSGEFGAQDVEAFFGGGDTGFTFKALPTSPRLGVRWLYGSGDTSASDGVTNTFVGTVARPPCCADPFWIAPANMRDVAPVLTLTPMKSLSVELKYDFVDRLESADAVYAVPLQAYPGTRGRAGASRLSTGPTAVLSYSPVPEVTLLVSHTEQSADGVLEDIGGEDARFTTASLTLRF